MMNPTFQIVRNGKVVGNFTLPDVAAKLKDGTILPTDTYWTSGMTEWASVVGLSVVLSAMTRDGSGISCPPPAVAGPIHQTLDNAQKPDAESYFYNGENMLERGISEITHKLLNAHPFRGDAHLMQTRNALNIFARLASGMSQKEVHNFLGNGGIQNADGLPPSTMLKYFGDRMVKFTYWDDGMKWHQYLSSLKKVKYTAPSGHVLHLSYHRYWQRDTNFENMYSLEGTLACIFMDDKLTALVPGERALELLSAQFGSGGDVEDC